ncbi:MAG: sugar nucleotide-binding protein [Cytophaga sp.]|nr:sugar nucleotide-binding protein [Undibacterium sp.]
MCCMKIVITGVTGYIGTRLTSLVLTRGHDVVIASRQRPSFSHNPWLFFDLASAKSIVLPIGTDAVMHLAANTQHTHDFDEQHGVTAAKKLIQSAKVAGAKFIFVSSQTARADAPTAYGRTKWRIEQAVLSSGGWVVRPGQVYGGPLRGLFGTLALTVRQLLLLPAFMPAPRVQPIHVDDLAEGLLRIIERGDVPPTVYCLAASEPVSFAQFMGEMAQSRLRCWRGFIPLPVVFIYALGKKLRTKLGLERLRSLFDLPVMATAADLKQLGLMLRPLRSGMHPSGDDRRRCVLQEGTALLTYVLKVAPGSALLRRYVRVIERVRGGLAVGLPQWLMNYPVALSMLDVSAWADAMVGADYEWRLDAATLLAEATPLGSDRFLGVGKRLERQRGALGSLIAITNAVANEVLWRLLRVLMLPLVRLTLSRTKGVL